MTQANSGGNQGGASAKRQQDFQRDAFEVKALDDVSIDIAKGSSSR